MNKFQALVIYTLDKENLTRRSMAEGLSDCMRQGKITYQSVQYWSDGTYRPYLGKILQVIRYSDKNSWQWKFAFAVEQLFLKKLD